MSENQSPSEEPNTNSAWQQQEGFILKASWFYNKKAKSEQPESSEDDFNVKIVGHPNWRFNFSVVQALHRNFEDAILAAKTFFKHSEFTANKLYIPPKTESAPINLSKKQRVKLIDQIMHGPREAKAESSGLLRTAFLDDGEDALWVTIEEIEYADEIERKFTDEDNPLQSLIGKNCSAYVNYHIDDEKLLERQKEHFIKEELETIKQYLDKKKAYRGKKTISGPLKIEEGVVSVGSWSYSFEDKGENEEEGEEATKEKKNKKSDSEEIIKVKGFPFLYVTIKAKDIGLFVRAVEGA